MTGEEIRPIAENYVEEYCHCSDGEYTDGSLVCAGIGTALIVSRQLEKRIAELEAQIEKMKSQYNYAFNQLCESREIVCLMLSQYKNKKEIDYSTKERGEKLLKQGVYKYD